MPAPPTDQRGNAPPIAITIARILLGGLGTAVGMWAIGFITHLPAFREIVPPPAVAGLLIAALLAAGLLIGRSLDRRAALVVGPLAGIVAGAVDLMVLGSLLASSEQTNALRPGWPIAIGGFLLFCAVVVGIGSVITARASVPPGARDPMAWVARLTAATAVAAVLVILSGGLVTSAEAGMAVPDWPTSYQANMFLYPLSKMTGGIYYEHSHQLFGSLVGFAAATTALYAAATGPGRRLASASTLLLLAVVAAVGFAQAAGSAEAANVRAESGLPPALGYGIVGVLTVVALGIAYKLAGWRFGMVVMCGSAVLLQGILGAERVTASNELLAFIHGITGQLTFALLCTTAMMIGPGYARLTEARRDGALRGLAVALLVIAIMQLGLGAGLRHFHSTGFMHGHITMAVVVLVIAVMTGVRAIARHREDRALKRFGHAVMHTVGLQIALGVAALIAVLPYNDEPDGPAAVVLATAHQAVGALLLAIIAMLFAWTRRAVAPGRAPEAPAAQAQPA